MDARDSMVQNEGWAESSEPPVAACRVLQITVVKVFADILDESFIPCLKFAQGFLLDGVAT